MALKIACLVCINLLLIFGGSSVRAQDFTVITETEHVNSGKIVGRSRTIFHAGEAYDQVPGLGEITIYQPGRQQFTIFSEARNLATTISFADIVANQREFDRQILSHVEQLERRGSRETLQKAAELKFQWQPEFDERFDAKKNELSMTSKYYSYVVETKPNLQPQIVKSYLRYADWTKQFNALLDPASIFPAPRLLVNQALRKRGAIPLSVSLKHPSKNGKNGLHLKSRHQIRWKLTDSDRAAIVSWQRFLAKDELKWITFQEFQAAVRPAGDK
ncbi:hypothetical protein CA54_13040 [Symmachiella macrocystis]|uniref:Uncharacterized protein n=1 Tax=Symmachiella macrocystis TaxID=2527985 RepID=A0A5C6BKB1_9PLAN|nr:hypothetical protein [Symmachiella macrocystis]TWU12480.1 hypothetical protein CA54_13040 [Symmachiella macrocystis]